MEEEGEVAVGLEAHPEVEVASVTEEAEGVAVEARVEAASAQVEGPLEVEIQTLLGQEAVSEDEGRKKL